MSHAREGWPELMDARAKARRAETVADVLSAQVQRLLDESDELRAELDRTRHAARARVHRLAERIRMLRAAFDDLARAPLSRSWRRTDGQA
jgi:hypothetical protein